MCKVLSKSVRSHFPNLRQNPQFSLTIYVVLKLCVGPPLSIPLSRLFNCLKTFPPQVLFKFCLLFDTLYHPCWCHVLFCPCFDFGCMFLQTSVKLVLAIQCSYHPFQTFSQVHIGKHCRQHSLSCSSCVKVGLSPQKCPVAALRNWHFEHSHMHPSDVFAEQIILNIVKPITMLQGPILQAIYSESFNFFCLHHTQKNHN